MPPISVEDIDLTLSTRQQLLKLIIGAAVGFVATKISDKTFDKAVFTQRVKELTNA